jgi:hypothetical protein
VRGAGGCARWTAGAEGVATGPTIAEAPQAAGGGAGVRGRKVGEVRVVTLNVQNDEGDARRVVNPTTPGEPSVEDVRVREARAVLDLDDRHRRALPTVVAGDLNAAPDAASCGC